MANQTAAELRALADAAEWREYLEAQLAKQKERVVSLQKRADAKVAATIEAMKKVKQLEAQLASGVVGKVPKPSQGGINIEVPTGTLNTKGN